MIKILFLSLCVLLTLVAVCPTITEAKAQEITQPRGAYIPVDRYVDALPRTDVQIYIYGSYERSSNIATNIDVSAYATNSLATVVGVYPFQNGPYIYVDVYYYCYNYEGLKQTRQYFY